VRWLLAEWPTSAAEPVKYWLSNLPADTPLVELVRLGKLRWRIEVCQPQCTHIRGLAA
jgi:SRSO17 transposase